MQRQLLIPGLLFISTVVRLNAQQPAREGAYISQVGSATIARESYRFADTTLRAEITLVSQGLRLSSTTRVDPALRPTAFHLTVKGASGDAVIQELQVTFADSAHWSSSASGATQQGTTAIAPPFTVLQNLQWSHLALALLRYDRSRGGPQSLNAWLPRGAQVVPMTMELVGDTGHVSLGGVTLEVKVDPTGWLHDVSVPSQSVTVVWKARLDAPVAEPRAGIADTVPPPGVAESPYPIHSGTVTLAGTLTLPRTLSGPVPVALIVAGSGPTDRDGNSALGIHPNSYAQLAWRLAERGIASLRYDKRGLPATQGSFEMAQTTFDDFVDDAIAAARALAADRRFSRVVILGHSEGAGLALLAANRGAPVAGIAMLAGLGRPFATVLREQLASQLDPSQLDQWDQAFARYLAGVDPGPLPPGLGSLVLPVNRRFMQTAMEYDPVAEIRRARVPVLIVQGATDIQIGVADAEALKGADPAATLVIIPDANHVFKRAPERSRASQTAQYADPSLPLVPELVDAVTAWVAALASHS